jgi:hypothetical protein
VRRPDDSGAYPVASAFAGETGWAEVPGTNELADALRSALRERYADASDEEVGDALADVFDSMSPAEAFNFASALHRIGKSAGQLVSDPAFVAVAQTALPVLGGAAGTMIGGPVGTALGSQLGSLAAGALPARPARLAAPAPATAPPTAVASALSAPPAPAPPGPPAVSPLENPPLPSASAPQVKGGSAAAAQGLVLTQQPDVLRSLLATSLGEHGRQTVSGIPVAQVLALLSQVFGKAAADADELMYLGQEAGAAESIPADAPADSADWLYADLLGADNLELAEVADWDWLDR